MASPSVNNLCECVIVSPEHLAAHEEEHAKAAKHICYVCHTPFSSAQALRIHLNTQYVKAAIHECACGAKYADPSRKSRCTKAHTMIYRCPDRGCDYRNSRKELVLRHLRQGKAHKLAAAPAPLGEPRFDFGPPKHLPGREPEELRPCTDEVLRKLTDMELMCKRYRCQRFNMLAEHFLSAGRHDLAEATKKTAIAFRDDPDGSRRTLLRPTSSVDSRTSLGTDPTAYDIPVDQYHPGALPYSPITRESPREEFDLPFDFFGDKNPQVINALDPFDPAPEGEWSNPIQHTLTSRQFVKYPELASILSQLQVHPGREPSDITIPDVLADE